MYLVQNMTPVDAFRKLITIRTFPARTLGQVSDVKVEPIVEYTFNLINFHAVNLVLLGFNTDIIK